MAKGSHGGAWKVAYADFVTAMMALFMVLWICAQDKKILLSTSRYFQSPFSSPMSAHSGVMPYEKSSQSSTKDSDSATKNSKPADSNKEIELSFLNSVAASVYRLLNLNQDLDQKPIDVQITSDGLRMTLYDRAKNPLFVENGSEFTPWGQFVMQNLAWLIDQHHFRITIDGHTRAKLDLHRENYSGWELSSERACAAERSLVHYAVDPDLIERVTGYSDTRPLPGEAPDSPSNQRITISLTLAAPMNTPIYQDKPADVPAATAGGGSPASPPSAFSPPAP